MDLAKAGSITITPCLLVTGVTKSSMYNYDEKDHAVHNSITADLSDTNPAGDKSSRFIN